MIQIYFTGASGTGKTTLLNYLREKYGNIFDVLELSARPYLPTTGSYDQTLTDEIQSLIVQHRTLSVLEQTIKQKNTIYSRGPVDNLSYQRVLKKGLYLDTCSKREIQILKDSGANFFYLPIEFEMTDKNDEVRGTNKQVQLDTDKEIQSIFQEFFIPFYIIKGSVEERCNTLDKVIDLLLNGLDSETNEEYLKSLKTL